MLKDGLWDVYNDFGMGVCGELCAEQHAITRDQQVVLSSESVNFAVDFTLVLSFSYFNNFS
jgi:acetyl-CoA acetyltransferase